MSLVVVRRGEPAWDAWRDYFKRFLKRSFFPQVATVRLPWPPMTDGEVSEMLRGYRDGALSNPNLGMPADRWLEQYPMKKGGGRPNPYDGRIGRAGGRSSINQTTESKS